MLECIKNPDNVPGAVTTGYQRQNEIAVALMTGFCTINPFDNGNGSIEIPAGGLFEINGKIFAVKEKMTVQKTGRDAANFIAVKDTGDTATVKAVTRPGKFYHEKNGCYLADGSRTLPWVSRGTLASPPSAGAEWDVPSSTVKKHTTHLSKGWKYVELVSGKGGGNGADGTGGTGNNANAGGAGGTVSTAKTEKAFFFHEGGEARAELGFDGKNGGKGGNGGKGLSKGAGGGGGGAGGGEASKFFTDTYSLETETVPGGLGGINSGGAAVPGGIGGNGEGCPGSEGKRGADGSDGTWGPDQNEYWGQPGGEGGAGGTIASPNGQNGSDGSSESRGGSQGGGGGGGAGGQAGWQLATGNTGSLKVFALAD